MAINARHAAVYSQNYWAPGSVVRVGFMKLRVIGSPIAVKDFMPDIYSLESLDGTKKYQFIPHHGLERVY